MTGDIRWTGEVSRLGQRVAVPHRPRWKRVLCALTFGRCFRYAVVRGPIRAGVETLVCAPTDRVILLGDIVCPPSHKVAARSGNWSDPATWGHSFPPPTGTVTITGDVHPGKPE